VYYSGHGFTKDGATIGCCIDGSFFHLETEIRKLATSFASTYIIAVFDCCRVLQKDTADLDYSRFGSTGLQFC